MIDAKIELEKLQQMYKDAVSTSRFNAIIYGPIGSGKTQLLRTCRPPVFVDSFDPGGTKTNKDWIDQGKMYVDIRWEDEDPKTPTVFSAWDGVYHQRKRDGFFAQLGTYAIDSGTTFAGTIMNTILKKAGRPGSFPFQQDYGPAMGILESVIKDFTTLPCDCILLCHEDIDKDDVSGKMFISPLFWGKLKGRLPLLFDEIYHTETKETSSGQVNYSLLTRATGLTKARTRLGRDGRFDMYEPQDISALLKKAGYV